MLDLVVFKVPLVVQLKPEYSYVADGPKPTVAVGVPAPYNCDLAEFIFPPALQALI